MRMKFFAFLAALFLLGSVTPGCINFEADPAPLDRFKTPVAALVHPNGQYAYVLNSNFDVEFLADRGGSVSVVDLETGSILAEGSLRVPSFGARMAFGGDPSAPDRLFVTTRGGNELAVLELSAAGDAVRCGSARDARNCVVRGPGRDLTGLVWLDRVDEGQGPIDLVAITTLGGTLSLFGIPEVLDLTTRVDTRGLDGGIALARSPFDGSLYVGGRFSGRLLQVSWATDAVGRPAAIFPVGAVELALVPTNRGLSFAEVRDIVHSEAAEQAYVVTNTPRGISIVDLREDADGERPINVVADRISLTERTGNMVSAIVDGRERLYVALPDVDRVAVIDTGLRRIVDFIDVGDRPAGLALDPTGLRLLVTHFGDDSIALVPLDPAAEGYHSISVEVR